MLGFLVTPTIILLLEDTQEIAIFIDVNEEEENKEKTSESLDLKIKVVENKHSLKQNFTSKKNKITFTSEFYTSHQKLKVHTPPPELFI
jgi:hypothetical protein